MIPYRIHIRTRHARNFAPAHTLPRKAFDEHIHDLPPGTGLTPQPLRERPPGDELHRDVDVVSDLPHIVHLHDVDVVEDRGEFGLAQEKANELGLRGELG